MPGSLEPAILIDQAVAAISAEEAAQAGAMAAVTGVAARVMNGEAVLMTADRRRRQSMRSTNRASNCESD
jgi:hypothetical protein